MAFQPLPVSSDSPVDVPPAAASFSTVSIPPSRVDLMPACNTSTHREANAMAAAMVLMFRLFESVSLTDHGVCLVTFADTYHFSTNKADAEPSSSKSSRDPYDNIRSEDWYV